MARSLLNELKQEGSRSLYPNKIRISVGMATCGIASGAEKVYEAIKRAIKKYNLDAVLKKVGCFGFCQVEPVADVLKPGFPRIIYSKLTPEKGEELVKAFSKGELKKEWALCKIMRLGMRFREDKKITKELEEIPLYSDLNFFKKQKRVVLNNSGFIDPESIEEYIAKDGYFALDRILKIYKPKEVINIIKASGLRGRGGAGFPTGLKWELTRNAKGEKKYILCNGDEGDPGVYKDRCILESDPYSVLEGMTIGAYAIGAKEGFIYIRAEYPLAIERFRKAIHQAEKLNLLGKSIMGSNVDFKIKVVEGGGAFICGEETALMASIEGKRGEPWPRPPYPSESGLWGRPTLVNNVETWATIPRIINRGAEWFSSIGSKESKGTKIFSLVGNVRNEGLIEVPIGTKLREIVFEIGDGIPNNKELKAIQTGGPSGGFIPKKYIDLPIDYERLKEKGSIMGSGGIVVMDEDTCIVGMARHFMTFLTRESCGKCTSCKIGTKRDLELLTKITEGKGELKDLDLLEELGHLVRETALCGFGWTAGSPGLSALRYFKDEYKEHIVQKRCRAGTCKALTKGRK